MEISIGKENSKKVSQFIVGGFLPKSLASRVFGLLAILVSWYFNKSIGWAIVHYLLGWVYLFYALVNRMFADAKWFDIIEYYLH